jgi:Protein of unknown function (DUF5131)
VPGHPFETGFDLTLRPERLLQPFVWKRPRMIFVNSMSDLFHKDIPRAHIAAVIAVGFERREDFELGSEQVPENMCLESSVPSRDGAEVWRKMAQ